MGRDFISFFMNLYCINFPNGKKYVGVETKTGARWRDHCKPPTNKKWTVVQRAVAKYGKENCKFEYICMGIERGECLQMEIDFIKKWNLTDRNFGYNVSTGGEGSNGIVMPESAKKILSEKTKELWKNPIFRAQCSKKRTAEQIQKNSETMKMVHAKNPDLRKVQIRNCHTEKARKKMSESLRGKSWMTEDDKKAWSERLKKDYASGLRSRVRRSKTDQEKKEISERLKKAYAEGKRQPVCRVFSDEDKARYSEILKAQYASGERTSRKGLKRTDPSPEMQELINN